jgi:hypothetical protein
MNATFYISTFVLGARSFILMLLVPFVLSATACAYHDRERRNIELFDKADFELFSKQDWPGFSTSHTEDVRVVMPDGREVHGMKAHMADMVDLFKSFPDMTIEDHPIKVAEGDWVGVVGDYQRDIHKSHDPRRRHNDLSYWKESANEDGYLRTL